MFPRGAAAVAAVTAVLCCWVAKWNIPTVLCVSMAVFLPLGGARYLQLLSRVLPRDIRLLMVFIKVKKKMDYCQQNCVTLPGLFSEVVSRHPDKTAVIFVNDGRSWSFRELDKYSNRVANHFCNLGVAKGNVVALLVENCPEHIGLSLGLWKLGAVAAYINTNLRQSSLLHCINAANPKYLVYSAHLAENVSEIAAQLEGSLVDAPMFYVCGGVCVSGESGDPGEMAGQPRRNLERELECVSQLPPPALQDKSFSDITAYIYTSGTTGLPKACRVPCSRTYLGSFGLSTVAHLTSNDIIYNCLPLYHSAGGIIALGHTLFHGRTMVLITKFSASRFFDDCTKYNCTTVQYIGEICRYLLSQPEQHSDTNNPVKVAIGNGLRPEIWTAFKTRFAIDRIVEFYASTEGVGACSNHDNKPGAVGHFIVSFPSPRRMTLVRRDPITGDYVRNDRGFLLQAGVNEPGELISQIDDTSNLQRYYGYTDSRASEGKVLRDVFKKGDAYYKSGDILRSDEEGYLYFCDRTGDTFRWKGENVSTTEVEGVMQKILDLKDVLVYGVLIPGTEGRAGMATINADEESVDVSELYLQLSKCLPRYSIPIFIRLTQNISLTSTYKLKKMQARDEGYDLKKVSDPVFLLHPVENTYVRLTQDLVLELENGNLKV